MTKPRKTRNYRPIDTAARDQPEQRAQAHSQDDNALESLGKAVATPLTGATEAQEPKTGGRPAREGRPGAAGTARRPREPVRHRR